MFALLGVDSVETEMSFAVSLENPDLEWAGSNLATIFGQKRNLLRRSFWAMLSDILRFNRESTAWLLSHPNDQPACATSWKPANTRCLLRLVPAADGGGHLVLPDRPDARHAARHLHPLLPEPRPAAGFRPADVAHRAGRRPGIREKIAAQLDDIRLACPVRA